MGQDLDFSGLANGFSSLLAEPLSSPAVSGGALQLNLDDIEEDPDQPRREFNPEALAELAESIKTDRVRVPISVQPRNAQGKYLINHGARRYRASRLAGRQTIPAFIDDSHDDFAQVVENIQRDDLSPREIAEFIGKRRALGDKDRVIGERLGKSKSYISAHAALLSWPPQVEALYQSGRCRDVTTLYSLIQLHKKSPADVDALCAGDQPISRQEVAKISAALDTTQQGKANREGQGDSAGEQNRRAGISTQSEVITPLPQATRPELRNPIIEVLVDGRAGVLQTTRRAAAGHGWVRFEESRQVSEIPLAGIQIVGIVEG